MSKRKKREKVFTRIYTLQQFMAEITSASDVSWRKKVYVEKGVTCFSCGRSATHAGEWWQSDCRNGSAYSHKGRHLDLYYVNDSGKWVMMTIDHVIPKCRGGSNHMSNLVPMCEPCNHGKDNKTGVFLKKCKEHDRFNCYDLSCKQDNAGDVGIDMQGDLTMGIGGGIGIDMSDGSITINGIDTDGQ